MIADVLCPVSRTERRRKPTLGSMIAGVFQTDSGHIMPSTTPMESQPPIKKQRAAERPLFYWHYQKDTSLISTISVLTASPLDIE